MSGVEPIEELDVLQNAVGEWGDLTFPEATIDTILQHAQEELNELKGATTREERGKETADLVMLLMHLAHRDGFSIHTETATKFAVCQNRKWLPADERGIVRHVKREKSGE